MKMLILRGLPASGKSTWAKTWIKQDQNHRVRVNRDDIRNSVFGVAWGVDEQLVTDIQTSTIVAAFDRNLDVVVDNTNLRARNVKDLMRLAYDSGAEVEFKDFFISLGEAVLRDSLRGEARVGDKVIKGMFDKFMVKGEFPPIPTLDNGESGIFPLYVAPTAPFKPHAIIVDIDGTVAHMTGRSPYDPTLYHTDEPDLILRNLIDSYQDSGDSALFVSGRNEDYRAQTEAWLTKHGFWFDELYMRPSDQPNIKDDIVKNELFEKYIAGNYIIDFVLDDRNRVVKMWRKKGLKVLQVAEGAF